MSKLVKCPVCDGRGFVKGNFYDVAGQTCSFGDYAKKEQSTSVCMRCKGNGFVNVEYKQATIVELLSCLIVVAFNDKKYSVKIMKQYLEKNINDIPQNIKETMEGLIEDFEKDLEEEK